MIGTTSSYPPKTKDWNWEFVALVTSSTSITLPDDWIELYLVVRIVDIATYYIPRSLLEVNVRPYITGACFTSTDTDNCGIGISFPTATKLNVTWGYASNANKISSTIMKAYIRR